MAQNQQSIEATEGQWTQITNADVTSITFQVLTGEAFVRYTADATTPTEANGVRYQEGQGEMNAALASLTNLAGAVRVWVKPASPVKTVVYVDHA